MPPPPPSSTKFQVGQQVQVTGDTVNVRSTPSTSGIVSGQQSLGAIGTVVAGSTYADAYQWWNINFNSGSDGWAVENYLTNYTAPAPPPPPPTPSAPVVSSAGVSVKKGVARFTWLTNIPSDSQVEYGFNTSYGTQSPINSNLVLSHTLQVSNLTPGTYNARVKSSVSGVTGVSGNLTFTVRSKPQKISNITVSSGSIVLNWPQISFNGYAGVAILRSTTGFQSTYNANFEIARLTTNSYTDNSVNPGTQYYYSLFVYDDQDNYSDPANVSFVAPATSTLPPPPSPTPTTSPTPAPAPTTTSGGDGGGSSSNTSGTAVSPTSPQTITEAERQTLIKVIQTQLVALIRQLIILLTQQLQNAGALLLSAYNTVVGR